MIVAMEYALVRRERWTTAHELAAVTAELVSALQATYVNAHVGKGGKIATPLSIPRPGHRSRDAGPRTVGAREFLRSLMGGGR